MAESMSSPVYPEFDALTAPLTGSCLLEASAGTGKTWTIAAMVLRLVVEANRPLGQILVVTFTNAACDELRQRIRDRLLAAEVRLGVLRLANGLGATEVTEPPPAADPWLEALIERLSEQGLSVDTLWRRLRTANETWHEARISTIHTYCARTLRQQAFAAGLPLKAEAMTSSNNERELIEQLVAQAWQRDLAHGEGEAELRRDLMFAYPPDFWVDFLVRCWRQPDARRIWPDEPSALVGLADHAIKRLRFAGEVMRRWHDELLTTLAERKRHSGELVQGDELIWLDRLLGNGEQGRALARELFENTPALLIDEFQDTDPLQWRIFTRIAHHESGSMRPGGLLFMVGDPKQAIYSFRQADLYVYLKARSEVQQVYALTANYRSTQAMVAAVNRLFALCQQPFLQKGIGYAVMSAHGEIPPLTGGRESDNEAMPLWQLPGRGKGDLLSHKDAEALIATATAAEIAHLLHGSLQIGGRPLRESDMAVLVSTNKQGSVIKAALAERGIAAVETLQSEVWDSDEAVGVVQVIQVWRQNAAIAAVREVLVGQLIDEPLSTLDRLDANDSELNDCLVFWRHTAGLWRQRRFLRAISEVENRYDLYARLVKRGEAALSRYRHVCDLIASANERAPTDESLWRWLRRSQDRPHGDEAALLRLESDRELVRVMTVHKAKGLEFPVVFCPFVAFTKGQKKGRQLRVYHDSAGDLVMDLTAADDRAKQAMAFEATAERLRQLYVAVTRAKYRCYLVGGLYQYNRSVKQALRQPLGWLSYGDRLGVDAWAKGDPLVPKKSAELALEAYHATWAEWRARVLTATDYVDTPDRLKPDDTQSSHEQTVISTAHVEQSRHFPVPINLSQRPEPAWTLTSFSRLLDESSNSVAERYGAVAQSTAASHDLSIFPRGTAAGVSLHAMLENLDFRRPQSWAETIRVAIERFPPSPVAVKASESQHWQRAAQALMLRLSSTPLVESMRLTDLTMADRQSEWEFVLTTTHDLKQRWQPVLQAARLDHDDVWRSLAQPGGIRGYIDLLFRWRNRYYILDWKSNDLGDTPAAYDQTALQRCIDEHGYRLQSLIYASALHRHLVARCPGYDYETHFGGCLIVFIRGVDGYSSQAIDFWRPPLTALAST